MIKLKILNYLIRLAIISVALICFTSFSSFQKYQLPRGEQLIDNILSETAKIIKDKYNLRLCGVGASMPGGPIQEATLCFDTNYPYTKDQLRELLIQLAQKLTQQVIENEEIQQYIKNPPFTVRNVQIIIYNHDKKGYSLRYPDVSNAQIAEGVLTYCSIDSEDEFKYKSETTESYEEALIKINK